MKVLADFDAFKGLHTKKSMVSNTLLVLISCNLVLLLTKLHPPTTAAGETEPQDGTTRQLEVEPISFLASRLLMMVMAYVSAMAYIGIHPTLDELLIRIRRTWKRPAITLLYIELFATASSSLLLMLSSFARVTRGLTLEILLVSGSIVLISCFGPVLFAHSDIACKLSLVVSIVEENCEGMDALERAGELVKERKLQGFVLTMVLTLLEQASFMVEWKASTPGVAVVGSLVGIPVQLAVKFLCYFVYTVFYHECKKSYGKRLK